MARADEVLSARVLAVLRLALLAIIVINDRLLDARHLGGVAFSVLVAVSAVFGLVGVVLAFRGAVPPLFARVQPAISLLLLTGLTMTSGGAFSDARRAFFVVPLYAGFRARPRAAAGWSLAAIAGFTVQAAIVGGHERGAMNTWQELTITQDLYMLWAAAAATLLALVLTRRREQTQALADSRSRLVAEAMESAERERTRLADALHDRPLQNLIGAVHDLRRAERTGDPQSFERLHRVLGDTITELRDEVFELHPHVLDHVGLDAALKQLARRHARDHGLEVTVDLDPEAARCHPDLLFTFARELLANAVKHARAGAVTVALTRDTGFVTLEVADDGVGIPDGRLESAVRDGHIGLAAIEERVPALGGRFVIATAAGRGTTAHITLPARRASDYRSEASADTVVSVPPSGVDRRRKRSETVDRHRNANRSPRGDAVVPGDIR